MINLYINNFTRLWQQIFFSYSFGFVSFISFLVKDLILFLLLVIIILDWWSTTILEWGIWYAHWDLGYTFYWSLVWSISMLSKIKISSWTIEAKMILIWYVISFKLYCVIVMNNESAEAGDAEYGTGTKRKS